MAGILDIIMKAKGKGASSDEEEEAPESSDEESDAYDGDACDKYAGELADILKVDRHDKDDFKAALRGLVQAEVREYHETEEEDDSREEA